MSNIHNKSGAAALAILEYEDNLLITWAMSVGRQLSKTQGLIEGSLCSSLPAMDGRYTVNGRKVAYGYQIVAFAKFGRSALVRVPAVKRSENDLVISHLCGTRNCCNPGHLVIEAKGLNDERVHCHFCIANVKKVGGWAGVAQFFQAGGCLHIPRCGHLE